jgi:phosphotransferase system enzyme I (PtsI)
MTVARALGGLGVSPGVAVGPAWRVTPDRLAVPAHRLDPAGVAAELTRLRDAIAAALKQLRKLRQKAGRLPDGTAEEMGYLLDARVQMLTGSRLVRGIERRITEELVNAEAAVHGEMDAIAAGFARMSDPYLAARGADVREVGERLLRHLMAKPYHALHDLPDGSIVVAEELTPADTLLLDPARVAGFATEVGGPEGHTAIVARSLGIPAAVGVGGLLASVSAGQTLLVDGWTGQVVVEPAADVRAAGLARIEADRIERSALRAMARLPAVTSDGHKVNLLANLELPRDVAPAIANGAAGVGLLRTEYLFMNRETLPTEDEQTTALIEVVEALGGRPATIRTLDIGGDKLAPALRAQIDAGLGDAPNPALGLRGVRLSLAHPKLLEAQLGAILRAGNHGPVRVLLPMVSDPDEVRRVRAAMLRSARRLKRKGMALPDPLPPIGVMIEVPGAALSADALALEADFFAIGSNDLTQYTLAIDRGDERVGALYNPMHPAVLRLIHFAIEAGVRQRREVCVCGEIAGDPRFTGLLLGLGVRDLSMAPPALGRVKRTVRETDLRRAVPRARLVMEQWDPRRIADLLAAPVGPA